MNTRPPLSPSKEPTGTQSIQRAVRLLRELAMRGSTGWRAQDLAAHCELDRATVHRILKGLLAERLVEQREVDRRYVIGPLSFELGMSVPHYAELTDLVRGTVQHLGRTLPSMTAVSSFLRSDNDVVCIARAGSASHVSNATRIRVGQRLPMLALVSGIAIIAALDPPQAEAARAYGRARLAHLGTAHINRTEALLKAGRRAGHVLAEGTIWRGLNMMSMSFGPARSPIGSLTLSASAEDYPTAEFRHRLEPLRECVESLTAQIGALLQA